MLAVADRRLQREFNGIAAEVERTVEPRSPEQDTRIKQTSASELPNIAGREQGIE
jgi:hypothetical protein